jgi:hypothetical protein
MPVTTPFHRTCRQFTDGSYSNGGRWMYVLHPQYANSPEHYVRAFLLLQKDLRELFDYVEPADRNLPCYSYRIHELLLRACVEVEANCKAILLENGYVKRGDLNMGDYKKINASHHLSSYEVKISAWHGAQNTRRPFAAWGTGSALAWYDAYNQTKHDRHAQFENACLNHLLEAVCGLVVLLSAQFITQDFSPSESYLAVSGPGDGFESAIGGFFRIKFPDDWPAADRYDFDAPALSKISTPFAKYPFPPP